jgi:hypothetical protein
MCDHVIAWECSVSGMLTMKLIDPENGQLHQHAYAKEKRKMEKKELTQAPACLMTSEENLDVLAEKDFMKHWKDVTKELALILKWIWRRSAT